MKEAFKEPIAFMTIFIIIMGVFPFLFVMLTNDLYRLSNKDNMLPSLFFTNGIYIHFHRRTKPDIYIKGEIITNELKMSISNESQKVNELMIIWQIPQRIWLKNDFSSIYYQLRLNGSLTHEDTTKSSVIEILKTFFLIILSVYLLIKAGGVLYKANLNDKQK